jgi:hypothetical protein
MEFELTEAQQQALSASREELVYFVDPQTGERFVLVKAEVYDRLKALLYDDGPPTDEEKRRQLAASGERAGWTDPAMDIYDNYEENRKLL